MEDYQDTVDHLVPEGYDPRKPLTKSKKFVGKEEIVKFIIVKNGKFLGKYAEFYSSILDARLMSKSEAYSVVGPDEEVKRLLVVSYVTEELKETD
jgi:hypothetical protein